MCNWSTTKDTASQLKTYIEDICIKYNQERVSAWNLKITPEIGEGER